MPEEDLAMETRAFHHGNTALQESFRNPHYRIERNIDECSINFFQLADMSNDRYLLPEPG
jgi:hypothetical protein